ncbi:hypothetical protein CGRA01v4_01980 [Colletotrichum graminicola]|nr:hypothetical protein CGRA01v4_01980 [Colletotrichum graminicola]
MLVLASVLLASSLFLTALAAPSPIPAAGAAVSPFTIICATVQPSDDLSASQIQDAVNSNKAALDVEGSITNPKLVTCTLARPHPVTQPAFEFTYANEHNDQAQIAVGSDTVICSSESVWTFSSCA